MIAEEIIIYPAVWAYKVTKLELERTQPCSCGSNQVYYLLCEMERSQLYFRKFWRETIQVTVKMGENSTLVFKELEQRYQIYYAFWSEDLSDVREYWLLITWITSKIVIKIFLVNLVLSFLHSLQLFCLCFVCLFFLCLYFLIFWFFHCLAFLKLIYDFIYLFCQFWLVSLFFAISFLSTVSPCYIQAWYIIF